jgi:RNA-binding motif X-linked protein 2
MPRDPNTGKPRGFAWLMYADQRSTVFELPRLLVPLELLIVQDVIDPERATENLSAVEVVDRENGRSLVGIHEPSEAARFARVWVARHVDEVLGRTLRVDHVLNYKQLERDQETGKLKERDEQRSIAGRHT